MSLVPSSSQAAGAEDALPPSSGEALQRPPELEPHGPSPLFHVVSDIFQLIVDRTGPVSSGGRKHSSDKRRTILERFFESWRLRVGKDLFPVVRMLVPERDRQRPNYGLKEQALAKGYVAALGLDPKTSSAAHTLLKWKQPDVLDAQRGSKGDFAQVAYEILESRTTRTRGKFTVDEVNRKLDELARASGDKKQKILAQFYNGMSAQEQKWLIRIILKDLKISVRERTVLSVLHPDATDLFNVCSDLQRVCYTLYSRDIRLPREDSVVGLFKAFRPMLCKRNERDLGYIVKLMTQAGGPEGKAQADFVIEEKLDGERMQLHKRGQEYRFWSRKDKDYTYLYGKTPSGGSLTPWIHDAFHENIEEIILDGEMLVWDPQLQKTQAFGNLKTAALNPTNDSMKCRPLFRVFDVLYAKGAGSKAQNFLHKPLRSRKQVMRAFFAEVPTRLEYAYETKGKTAEDIKASLTKILEERGEGLVVKRNDSHYVLNGREDTWVKVKPDYMDEFGETLDLIVVGGYWGQGRRGGRFGSFLCALFDDQKADADRDATNARWLTACKVGSGFSYTTLEEIMKKFGEKFTNWDRKNSKNNPEWLVVGATAPEVPDQWIHPADSFVVKVKAAEIVGGEGYGAGLCLRFPRCLSVEWNKDYLDTMSFDEYYEIRRKGTQKRNIGDDLSGHKSKKRKTNTKKAQIISSFKGADVSNAEVKNDLFEGITFYVMEGMESAGDDEQDSKQVLEAMIYEHGGEFIQAMPKAENKKIISRTKDYYTANKVIKQGHDIVHPSWVVDSIAKGRLLPLSKKYLVHASDTAKETSAFEASDDGADRPNKPANENDADDSGTEDEEDAMDVDGPLVSQQKRVSPIVEHEWVGNIEAADKGKGKGKGKERMADSEGSDTLDDTDDGEEAAGEEGPGDFDKLKIASPAKRSRITTRDPDGSATEDEDENGDDQTEQLDEEDAAHHFIAPKPGMGTDTAEMNYGTESKMFEPLMFYLDTRANAVTNELAVEDWVTNKGMLEEAFERAESVLRENGGRVTTKVLEPSLTHIVVADADAARAVKLMRMTNKPRRRRLVTPDWIFDSVTSGALVDESNYIPAY